MGATLRGLLLVALMVSGCAHRYVYSGALEARDSLGNVGQHLIYWNKTTRPLWFDSQEGSVRILPQCSLNTLAYDEQPTGIIFRARDRDKHVLERAQDKHVCGRILNADRIIDLSEGSIRVTVSCEDAPQDDLDSPQPYLKAREQPYEFPVTRREVSDFSEIPKRPECRRD
ncbi:MAG: hypothetical protein M1283_01405 [Gammaproteobacteria bacterium]|nr:hypothetical protein [Gammaproteobacteria bacterium]